MLVDSAFSAGSSVLVNSLYLSNCALYLVAVSWRPAEPIRRLPLVLIAIVIAMIITSQPATVVAPILLVVWVTFLPVVLSVKLAWFAFVLINSLFVIITVLYKSNVASMLNSLSFVGFQLFSMSNTLLLQKESLQRIALEQTNLELAAAQQLLKEKAKTEERHRIYRDLHDSVGHQLTALSLNIEHARHQPPSDLIQFLDQTKQGISAAMTELRSLARLSREQTNVSLTDTVASLITPLANIQFKAEQAISVNDTHLAQQLIFVLKEGISNAIRHGSANTLQLQLETEAEQSCLRLIDNGTGFKAAPKGTGLNGMQERLSTFKGHVELCHHKGGGTALCIYLPRHYFHTS